MSEINIAKQTFAVGGIEVHVYSDPSLPADPTIARSCPLAVLFLLHGRTESVANVESMAKTLVRQTHDRRIRSEGGKQLDLMVATFVSLLLLVSPVTTKLLRGER